VLFTPEFIPTSTGTELQCNTYQTSQKREEKNNKCEEMKISGKEYSINIKKKRKN